MSTIHCTRLTRRSLGRSFDRSLLHSFATGFAALCGLASLSLASPAHAKQGTRSVAGHLAPMVAQSNLVGSLNSQDTISVALLFPMRNQAQLDALLAHLYNPNDPLYGQYLTPAQFTAQFAPTQSDYNEVVAYVQSQGLTVVNQHPNRMVLDVQGPVGKIQTAFGVQLKAYKAPTGRIFRAPTGEPVLPTNIANKLLGIVGLDNSLVPTPFFKPKPADPLAFWNRANRPASPFASPAMFGNGPAGGLTPQDIQTAYDLSVTADGTGQTLGLVEFDGFTQSDIDTYVNQYQLNGVPLQTVLVDGFNGQPTGTGNDQEVTLDIELMQALAPNLNSIYVYEGPINTGGTNSQLATSLSQSMIDICSRMATDNLVSVASISWGVPESQTTPALIQGENNAFKQLAVQGISVFAASGDSAAYADNGWVPTPSISVSDPGAQPWVTSVGGTYLTLGAKGVYQSETTWSSNDPAGWIPDSYVGSGGGISSIWPIPSYQTAAGVITAANLGSAAFRNLPDVALDADPFTGYSYYWGGAWGEVGGTSCAAPLWAAFTALVNQQRATVPKAQIGFMNPAIYTLGTSANYSTNFHDINDNSNNLKYPAVTGYDLATGWGSFEGFNLLGTLSGVTPTRIPPPPQPAQLLGDPGFENGHNYAPWVATSSSIVNNYIWAPANTGNWKALLGNTSTRHTDKLYQSVYIPSYKKSLTLSYAMYIASNENPFKAYDTLTVMVRNAANTATLETLAVYDNTMAAGGYTPNTHNLNVKKYANKTIIIMFQFSQAGLQPTAVLLDDINLNGR